MHKYTGYYGSPIGTIEIQATDQAITSVTFVPDTEIPNPEPGNPEVLRQCLVQLDEYFKGTRLQFQIPTIAEGSPFEKLVWKELQNIPFGSTATYAEVATRLGNRRAIRAVGSAATKNKLLLLIPCHRMVGSGGSMTGYSAGIPRKESLLRLEAGAPTQPSLF